MTARQRRALSFSPVLPLLIASVTMVFTLLSALSATAQNGLPSNSYTDRTLPPFRIAPNTRQPDFRLPDLPAGRLVDPKPPRVLVPAPPPAPSAGASDCPQVFAPVCGRIGNGVTSFSNSCRMRAAGAVPVSDALCRGS